jgi:hypothetical protein
MAAALEADDVVGRRITTMAEPGEVYEFLFYFENRKLYGKINLLKGGHQILIYSSHRLYKRDTL